MEVHAIDALSGREEPLEIDADATVSTMKRRCGEAFGFGEDVELSVDGQRVVCAGAERISNVAAFSGGCQVRVARGVARFVTQLRSGAVKMDDIPVWARQRRECVLAVLARALENRGGGDKGRTTILPHWVHPSLHDDKEVMLQFVRCDPDAFLRASPALRSDADIVIAVLRQDASMWRHVEDKSLQDQRSVAVVAVPHCSNSAVWLSDKVFLFEALENGARGLWEYVSETLQRDKEVVMKALHHSAVRFSDLSEELRRDKEVAINALGSLSDLNDISQLCETLQQDKEIVLVALEVLGIRFHGLSEVLRADKEVVMAALASGTLWNGTVKFSTLSEALRGDKEVVMRALEVVRVDFRDLGKTLQGDNEVVMKARDNAVKFPDPTETLRALAIGAVKFGELSQTMRDDKEVVMKALECDAVDFGDLIETLRDDKEVVMKALECDTVDFGDLNETLRADKEVVMKALDHAIVKFSDLSEALQGEKEVVIKLLERSPHQNVFHKLSKTLQQDKEIAMKGLHHGSVTFSDLSKTLQQDKQVVMKAVSVNSDTYMTMTGPLRQDKDVALSAVVKSPPLFRSMSGALRDDLDVALPAIRDDPRNFVYCGDSVRAKKEAALTAFCEARNAPVLLLFASAELQADREVVIAAVRANAQNALYASPALQDLEASGL